MYCDLDKLEIIELSRKKVINFIYNKKEYFFKPADYEHILKELVAEKIANRFDIACCRYFPAIYKNTTGIASESAYGLYETGYRTMEEYYEENGYSPNLKMNNLQMIWDLFDATIDIPPTTVKKLMDQVTDIFIFDALIGNIDRNYKNFGIIQDGRKTRMAPIFDNENMLNDYSITSGKYNLTIEKDETIFNTPGNFLYKFLDISDKYYLERLKEGLKIISEESLIEIFKELKTEGIILDATEVQKILDGFSKNREMINNYFNKKKSK